MMKLAFSMKKQLFVCYLYPGKLLYSRFNNDDKVKMTKTSLGTQKLTIMQASGGPYNLFLLAVKYTFLSNKQKN